MKKILFLLFALPLFVACSSDEEETQDYTSFTFIYHANVPKFSNCVVGHLKDGGYVKIAELGDLVKDVESKEIIVNDKSIKEVYLFSDYNSVIRFDDTYNLKLNTKNKFTIKEATKGIQIKDKTDATQYPQ